MVLRPRLPADSRSIAVHVLRSTDSRNAGTHEMARDNTRNGNDAAILAHRRIRQPAYAI